MSTLYQLVSMILALVFFDYRFWLSIVQSKGTEPSGKAIGKHAWYRGTSRIRNRPPLGPYIRSMPMALWLP